MVEKLVFGLVYSEFDETRGPVPIISYPEISREFGTNIASKSIDILTTDAVSQSLAVLPFPTENKKGIVRNLEWVNGSLRGGYGAGSLTLIYEETDEVIFYKFIKDLEALFDEATKKITNLKSLNADKNILYTEIKKIHKNFRKRLTELRDQESGSKDDSKAFPDGKSELNKGYQFKIVVCGDPSCGKTSTILKFTDSAFRKTYIPTIGVNVTRKEVAVNENNIDLVLWDIAGQVKFQVLRRHFYEGAQGFLLLFDVTRANTFESISNWYEDIKKHYKEGDPIVLLCGNKIDLKKDRWISTQDGKALAEKLNIDYIETSALTGENIDQAFFIIAEKVLEVSKVKD